MKCPTSQLHSEKLITHIRSQMELNGGSLSFAHFMQSALYTPGLGYYSAGQPKLGKTGDFVTAPEISNLFGRCLSVQCSQILQHLGGGDILELGAGTGVLAQDLLRALDQCHTLPNHYYI